MWKLKPRGETMTDVKLLGLFQEWTESAGMPFSETAFNRMGENLRTMSAYFSSFKSRPTLS